MISRTRTAPSRTSATTVRCAIYTRKSSEEGLEQEFNSLDAQRESGENYIASQAGEGWTCLPDRYDDGGFTGGNMERPALRRLMADIESGNVDCVVIVLVVLLTGAYSLQLWVGGVPSCGCLGALGDATSRFDTPVMNLARNLLLISFLISGLVFAPPVRHTNVEGS